jgi:hypothetical protein
MKGTRNVILMLLFLVFATGNYAYSDTQYRSSCRNHRSHKFKNGHWTPDMTEALSEVMFKGSTSKESCWIDQKRKFHGIRLPSKRISLTPKALPND